MNNEDTTMKTEVVLQQGTESQVKTKTVTWNKDNSNNTHRMLEVQNNVKADGNDENIAVEPLTSSPKMPTLVSTTKNKQNKFLSSIKRQFTLKGTHGKCFYVMFMKTS